VANFGIGALGPHVARGRDLRQGENHGAIPDLPRSRLMTTETNSGMVRPTSARRLIMKVQARQNAKETTKDVREITDNELDVVSGGNVRSQAEKRLETMRKDLTRNWGG
jgi:hypothetical protein